MKPIPLPAQAPAALAIALLAAGGLSCAATGGTPGNVDTGIRDVQCYAVGSDALRSCSSANISGQDGQLGRDTDPATNDSGDGTLGLSFTRICNSGDTAGRGSCPAVPLLGNGPDDWGCVKDNLTLIMWEVKPASGWRSRELRYTDYSPDYDPVGEYGSATDAAGYVANVNAAALCGFSDWGLAHTDKVQTTIDYGVSAPATARVDPAFFPNTQADWYWNDSPNLASQSAAFAVNFADGSVSNSGDRSTPRFVQVLRNVKAITGPGGRYVYSPDGTEVIDTVATAQLTWRRCVEGMSWSGKTCTGTPLNFTHEQALLWAAQQSIATGVAWRVPSVKELDWIVDREEPPPTTTHTAFPYTPMAPMWSSSPEVRHPALAWAVDFNAGLVVQRLRTEGHALRLVRDDDSR